MGLFLFFLNFKKFLGIFKFTANSSMKGNEKYILFPTRKEDKQMSAVIYISIPLITIIRFILKSSFVVC